MRYADGNNETTVSKTNNTSREENVSRQVWNELINRWSKRRAAPRWRHFCWPLDFMDTDNSVIIGSLVIFNSYCSNYLHKLFIYLTKTDNGLF